MTAITFDTLKYTKTLESAGIPRQHAEAQAVAQRESLEQVFESHFDHTASKEEVYAFKSAMKADFIELRSATRADLRDMDSSLRSEIKQLDTSLRGELRELELRVTIKLGGMIVALGGVLIAVKYLG
jgi:hypothetical protein